MVINYYNYININTKGDIIMAKKDFDVLEIVEKAAKKLLSDEKLQEQFKKEPIKALEPDVIICTGDIVDSAKDDVEYAVNLGKELSKIAPSYYVYGNNASQDEGFYKFQAFINNRL